MSNNATRNNNSYYLDTIDPSNLLQSSNPATHSESFLLTECTSIDDWLADELCKEGLLANAMNFDPEKILALLPRTPPISPSSSVKHEPVSPIVPLFPEIVKQKPILPKSNLPRIAPRPCATGIAQCTKPLASASPVMMSQQKRRSDSITSSALDQDEITLKRQKNTDAARRSRLKKLVKMEQLEKKVSDLEADNNHLTTRIAVLESEKSGLQMKDVSLEERIKVLEAQLSEAHRALTKNQF